MITVMSPSTLLICSINFLDARRGVHYAGVMFIFGVYWKIKIWKVDEEFFYGGPVGLLREADGLPAME
jgi:hypothetical protein